MKKYKRYSAYPTVYGFLFAFVLLSVACNRNHYPVSSYQKIHSPNGLPDYSNLDYWAAHPYKHDPSDSVPSPLLNILTADSSVDVFFLYPTSFTDRSDTGWNARIDDPELNAKTDYSSILFQASAFNTQCRVFSPRYRQANIRAFFVPDSVSGKYFDIAYKDIRAAFTEYLSVYNQGRPIIIASHSQGTLHAARLMKEFFDNKPLLKQLVCAYIIGLPVPADEFSVIKPCSNATETGCFVSWRSFKSGYKGDSILNRETKKMAVINPLSWRMDDVKVGAEANKGGILRKFNKLVPRVVSAQVHGNILWTSKPDMPGKILLTTKNYHIGDINLFYLNIRENITDRIAAYRKLQVNK